MAKLPKPLLKRIQNVTNKRARFVLNQIAANGIVTTEEIEAAGYNHPPRAVQDARELGFVLPMSRVKSSTGKSIAAYTLDVQQSMDLRKGGRRAIPKKLRDNLLLSCPACTLCGSKNNLQLDHRVPYSVAGERAGEAKNHFMVACGYCQRSKSWECEHCPNIIAKHIEVCELCYWASPGKYTHVATRPERRLDLVIIAQEEIQAVDKIAESARRAGLDIKDSFRQLLLDLRNN